MNKENKEWTYVTDGDGVTYLHEDKIVGEDDVLDELNRLASIDSAASNGGVETFIEDHLEQCESQTGVKHTFLEIEDVRQAISLAVAEKNKEIEEMNQDYISLKREHDESSEGFVNSISQLKTSLEAEIKNLQQELIKDENDIYQLKRKYEAERNDFAEWTSKVNWVFLKGLWYKQFPENESENLKTTSELFTLYQTHRK